MIKKNRTTSISNKLKKLFLGLCTTLIFTFYFWLASSADAVEFPDLGTPAKLYSTETQDDLGLVFCSAINEAKESVTLIIYTLKDSRIINCLKKKGNEGCYVEVICEAKEAKNIKKRLGPKVKLVKRFINGLMHQKILIIDKKQTWIGSANMTRESLRYYGNLVAAIDNEPLATLAAAKAQCMTVKDRLPTFPHQQFRVGGQNMELSFLPDDRQALDRLKKLIRTAKKTIRIAMYTWTHEELAKEVVAAKERGIDVKVVIDNGTASGTSSKIVELFQKSNVSIKCNRGTAMLHHKFMYIDDSILVNGSTNWTASAFKKNDDCFFILHDLCEEQKNKMNHVWSIIEAESVAR